MQVTVTASEQLTYLLGQEWTNVVVLPRKEGRDHINYDLTLPVSLCFFPKLEYMTFKMESLRKSNKINVEQWDTRYAAKNAPIIDGEEDDDGLDDLLCA